MIKIGQEVFYKEPWSGCITKAIVDYFDKDNDSIVHITDVCHPTYPKNDICYKAIGSRMYSIHKLYTSLDNIKEAIKNEWNESVNNYKNQIKNIEDLINFPLHHCFNGEEYTNEEAMYAYKERAKELGFIIYE